MERIDLGVCPGMLFAGDPDRFAVVLPGAGYPVSAPLLWFATGVAHEHGWSVVQVLDRRRDATDATAWGTDRAAAALAVAGSATRRVLIAKSITTLALPLAVDLGLPGAWLTPLLGVPEVRDAARRASTPTLLAGGTADPTWDGDLVRDLPNVTTIEIEDADHTLQVPGDLDASLGALQRVTAGIGVLLDEVE